jgi:hypothetical protein
VVFVYIRTSFEPVFEGVDQRSLACALRANDVNNFHDAVGKAR